MQEAAINTESLPEGGRESDTETQAEAEAEAEMKGQDMKLRAAHSRVWGQQNPVQRGLSPGPRGRSKEGSHREPGGRRKWWPGSPED